MALQAASAMQPASLGHAQHGHGCAALPARRLTQYAASKLCNILHTRELQDRYQQSRGIIATSCSPGFVNTSIFRQGPEQPEL